MSTARRSIAPEDIARLLRSMTGLPPECPPLEESAAWYPREAPTTIENVDVAGWIAFALAGLEIFSRDDRNIRHAEGEVRRVLTNLAMMADGKITTAADDLGCSRRIVRATLKKNGAYPWTDPRSGSRSSV